MAEVIARGENLEKLYEQGNKKIAAVQGVCLEIRAGELLSILGPSGSGKSTLLHLVGLMDEPTSGTLWLFGRNAGELKETEKSEWRNRKLGFLFQFNALLPELTLEENVFLPLRIAEKYGVKLVPSQAEQNAFRWLVRLGLGERRDHYPNQVSGGELQRAALARALVTGPRLLLADEPTGNLDKTEGELVLKSLREVARETGAAVVLVSHNEKAREFSDASWRMIDGKLYPGSGEETPAIQELEHKR